MKNHYVILGFMLIFSLCTNANSLDDIEYRNEDIIDRTISPEKTADSIVVFVPNKSMSLDKPKAAERIITGKSIKVEKGLEPNLIIHSPDTIILPLKENVPMKIFLKQFPDRDAYYPIAIYPITDGVKP